MERLTVILKEDAIKIGFKGDGEIQESENNKFGEPE